VFVCVCVCAKGVEGGNVTAGAACNQG
jgi:hypothetical protein